MKINGKEIIPSRENWVSDNGEEHYDSLWYQPTITSYNYPHPKGRLLEYCKAEDINSTEDDYVEIPIDSIEDEITVVDYWFEKMQQVNTKEEKINIIEKLDSSTLEKLFIQKYL